MHLAARFCAKEAVAKALALEVWNSHDVEVVREGDGAPEVRLSGHAAARASELGGDGGDLADPHPRHGGRCRRGGAVTNPRWLEPLPDAAADAGDGRLGDRDQGRARAAADGARGGGPRARGRQARAGRADRGRLRQGQQRRRRARRRPAAAPGRPRGRRAARVAAGVDGRGRPGAAQGACPGPAPVAVRTPTGSRRRTRSSTRVLGTGFEGAPRDPPTRSSSPSTRPARA